MQGDHVERLHAVHRVQAEHHHPGDPEEQDVVAGDQHAGRVELRQVRRSARASPASRTATAPRRTRCPARPRPAASPRRSAAPRPGRRRRSRRPGRTRPGCGGPTTAGGRCTSRACCRPRRSSAWPARPARSATRPSRTASPAALASGPVLTNHCSDSRGSTVVLQREQCPTACTYGRFSATIRPCSRSAATIAGRASNRSSPWNGPGAVITPRSSMIGQAGQVVPLADLEVVRVVRRGHLDRAGAERRVDVLVGDDRDAPAGQRQLDLGADQVPVPLVVRVHGHRGVAEHRLGPGGGHHDRVASPYRIETSSPSSSVCSTSMSRQRGQAARAPVDDPLRPGRSGRRRRAA